MKYSFLKINGALFSVALLLSTPGVQANFATKIAAVFRSSKHRIGSFFSKQNHEPCHTHLQHLQSAVDSLNALKNEVDQQPNLTATTKSHIKTMIEEACGKFSQLRETITGNQSHYIKLASMLKLNFGSTSAIMKKIQQDLTNLSKMLVEQGMAAPELDTLAAEIERDNQQEVPTNVVLDSLKHRLNCK